MDALVHRPFPCSCLSRVSLWDGMGGSLLRQLPPIECHVPCADTTVLRGEFERGVAPLMPRPRGCWRNANEKVDPAFLDAGSNEVLGDEPKENLTLVRFSFLPRVGNSRPAEGRARPRARAGGVRGAAPRSRRPRGREPFRRTAGGRRRRARAARPAEGEARDVSR